MVLDELSDEIPPPAPALVLQERRVAEFVLQERRVAESAIIDN